MINEAACQEEASRLAEAFIRDFWSSNHEIKWDDVEAERSIWLDENTMLAGKLDGIGQTPGDRTFFGDWKTLSKYKAKDMQAIKRQWRMNPQALTYGVLMGDKCRQFTVRWMIKTIPATTDFEWYEYQQSELDFWRQELLNIANMIREYRVIHRGKNWPLNLTNCTRYGENYKCPFRDEGCWRQNFGHVPEGMSPKTESHLALENSIRKARTDMGLVILDASRTSAWMECQEFYRRMWENSLDQTSEALYIGSIVHELIAAHLNQIRSSQ